MKKIDALVREHLRELCYEVVLFEIINHKTRRDAQELVANYLNCNDYNINWVKCDCENNPPDMIDSGRIKIEISEQIIPGSSTHKVHTIFL